MARREAAALKRQSEADGRLEELRARLAAGDTRARQMQQELDVLQEQMEADAKEAASKHVIVEKKLRSSEAALQVSLADSPRNLEISRNSQIAF